MRKKLVIILGGLAVVLLLAYFALSLGVGSVVTSGVNRFGPGLTGTPVELNDAHLSPLSGTGSLEGLTVGNPKGWSAGNAFVVKKISVSAVPSSLLTDHIVVREVVIDGADVSYETHLVSSNLGQLVSNLQRKSENSAGAAKTKSGDPIHFVIQHLVMKNSKVRIGVGPAAVVLDLPDVEYHDLGAGGAGLNSTQLAALVTQTLMKTVVDTSVHVAGKVGSTMGAAAGDAVKDAGSAVEGLFKH